MPGIYRLFIIELKVGANIAGIEDYLEKVLHVSDPKLRKKLIFDTPSPLLENEDESLVLAIKSEIEELGVRAELKRVAAPEKVASEPPPQPQQTPSQPTPTDAPQDNPTPAPQSPSFALGGGFKRKPGDLEFTVVEDDSRTVMMRMAMLIGVAAAAGAVFALILLFMKTPNTTKDDEPNKKKERVSINEMPEEIPFEQIRIPAPQGRLQIPEEEGIPELDEAAAALQNGNFDRAIELLESLIAQRPDDTELTGYLVKALVGAANQSAAGGDFDKAYAYLSKAETLQPQNIEVIEQIGGYYYSRKETDKALDYLARAANLGSQNPDVYAALALIYYYNRDEMDKAVENLDKAIELDPTRENLVALRNKIERESKVEDGFEQTGGTKFNVKYQGGDDANAANSVLYELERAYSAVGYDLGEYPPDPLTVVLYTNEQFSAVTNTPHWVGGVFDGRIKLPTGGLASADENMVRRLVFHEYTHAVIYRITNGNCPVWFNEGLAQTMQAKSGSNDPWLNPEMLQSGKIFSLSQLSAPFLKLNSNDAQIAYIESYYATQFFIEQYGLSGARSLLAELGKGANFRAAFKSVLGTDFNEFESRFNDYIQTVR